MNAAGAVEGLDLTALFRAEASSVFGFLLLRTGSRSVAEDLTGETFLAACNLFAAGRGREVTPAWLQTVAKRRLVDHWRSSAVGRRRALRLEAIRHRPTPAAHDPDSSVDSALASMPERQRAALVLCYIDDHSVSETATMLGLSYKAAESLLTRARASFAISYEEIDNG